MIAIIINFSNDSMWANRLPKLVFVDMMKVDGNIVVKAPGMNDLVIDAKDLEYEKSREISSKMQDVHIKLILCGDVYDEWFSTYLKGTRLYLMQMFRKNYNQKNLEYT